MRISRHRHRATTVTSAETGVLTLAEVMTLPAVTDLISAGKALGIGRTRSYELARAGEFPCPVVRVGKTYRVPTADLLALLGMGLHQAGPAARGGDRDDDSGALAAPPRHRRQAASPSRHRPDVHVRPLCAARVVRK